jgi:AcrR family transcriptional regulator
MSSPRRDFDRTVRERRQDARRRILDAAAELLEERAWNDVAVDTVMAKAELSRTVFYRHFGERVDLLLALLEQTGLGSDPAGAQWKVSEAADPRDALASALTALTDFFARHGRVLRVAAEAAAHEPQVAAAWAGFADEFVATTAARIEADRAAGRSPVRDAYEVARALVWMNERYLLDCFGRRPFRVAPDVAAAALVEVWSGAVYGTR